MKKSSIYTKIFIGLIIILIGLSIFIEVTRDRGPLRFLSSREYTKEVVSKINLLSLIYTFLIIYLFVLVGVCFVRIIQFLTSNLVGGSVIKVISICLLYIVGIIVAIRGYSNLLFADNILQKAGQLRQDALSTVYSHIAIIICIVGAYYLKESIKKELRKKHEIHRKSNGESFEKLDILKNIIGDK